ncbi:MAG: signal peptidase I [Acutalibacteraceae bacterium]
MKKKTSVLKKISNVLLVVVIFILAGVIALTVITRITGNTPTLFGYSIFRVTTGSMEPELMIGDVILTKEIDDVNSLQVGDVITYQGTVGEYTNMMITHKIVKAPYEDNGNTYVITKGVANDVEDQPVEASHIISKFVCKIPFLDLLYSFFLTPWGLLTAIVLIFVAFAGEFWNIFKLSHQEVDQPKMNKETLEKAIEQYQAENASGTPSDSSDADIDDKQDNQDNTNE